MGWSRDYPYTLEVAHASIHNYVGGDFADPQLTANDPLFFVLHSFVDLIFEQWRQKHQSRESRNISYPAPDILCHTPDHYYYSPMFPFFGEDNRPIQNNDALGNIYTDEFYEYAPRPTCSQPKYDCGSKYLFCDRSHGSPRCASKIKIGGNCTGYNQGEEPCHNGQCKNNICVKIRR